MAYKDHNPEVIQPDDVDNEDVITDVEDTKWLGLAQDAYRSSTDYFDSSLRKQIERNLSHFRSKHAAGSKYHSNSYRHRSKLFRPKTRSAMTRNEAQAAVAFFSTDSLVDIRAQNEADDIQRVSAELNNALLNYRLENDIPWFQTTLGAFQDAMNTGVVISKQHWEYEEKVDLEYREAMDEHGEPIMDAEGNPEYEEFEVFEGIISDKPKVDIIPIENCRWDPGSDWRDPVGSSPYWITQIPMFLGDVRAKMDQVDAKTGQPKWRKYDDATIMSAVKQDYDSVRQAREGTGRQDSKDRLGRTGDFQIVWIHENIIRRGNQDYIYYTLGTERMLTDPVPVEEVYIQGRPYVMGNCVLETHRNPPSGLPEIWDGLQTEINSIANQRIDNVSLVLNTRYFVNRSADVDTRGLTESVPGGTTLMDDVNNDVRADRPADVTSSSYAEQDRLNADFDDVAGNFSTGSVQTSRQMNETVGGMEMLSSDANSVTEYRLRLFTETWVEPVLRQLVTLEQAYEDDEVILNIAGHQSGIFEELGISRIPDELIEQPVITKVKVGFGNTNPQQRVEKLVYAINSMAAAYQIPGIDIAEVRSEVFGSLGYKDGARFFNDEEEQDPEKMQMQQMIEELQAKLQGKQAETEAKFALEQMKQEGAMARDAANNQVKLEIEQAKVGIQQIDRQLKAAELKGRNEIEVGKLLNQREALIFQMRLKENELSQQNLQGRMSQTIMNDEYGAIPGQRG